MSKESYNARWDDGSIINPDELYSKINTTYSENILFNDADWVSKNTASITYIRSSRPYMTMSIAIGEKTKEISEISILGDVQDQDRIKKNLENIGLRLNK